MTLLALLNTPCTLTLRYSSGNRDDYGNEIPGEAAVETVCELQQKARDEPGDQGELSDTHWLVILPAGTALETGDAITIGDAGYEVVGDPWHARNPRTKAESHVEATVRRTAGDEAGS